MEDFFFFSLGIVENFLKGMTCEKGFTLSLSLTLLPHHSQDQKY